MAARKGEYSKTWHPGTPKQQSAAARKIAANKRSAAKRAQSAVTKRMTAQAKAMKKK